MKGQAQEPCPAARWTGLFAFFRELAVQDGAGWRRAASSRVGGLGGPAERTEAELCELAGRRPRRSAGAPPDCARAAQRPPRAQFSAPAGSFFANAPRFRPSEGRAGPLGAGATTFEHGGAQPACASPFRKLDFVKKARGRSRCTARRKAWGGRVSGDRTGSARTSHLTVLCDLLAPVPLATGSKLEQAREPVRARRIP